MKTNVFQSYGFSNNLISQGTPVGFDTTAKCARWPRVFVYISYNTHHVLQIHTYAMITQIWERQNNSRTVICDNI